MQRRALIIMAKSPLSENVKTRLAPEYNEEERREIYARLLEGTIGRLREIKGTETMIAFTPQDHKEQFMSYGLRLFPQIEGSIGQRMSRAIELALGEGYERVALVGADIPGLTHKVVEKAFEVLERADMAMGPSLDGGYYLIAMKRPHPGIFEDIPWSSPDTLARTLQKAVTLGINVELIDNLTDIDTPDDLRKYGRLL